MLGSWGGGGEGCCSPLHHLPPQPPAALGATDLLLHHVEGVEHVDGELHEDGSYGIGVGGDSDVTPKPLSGAKTPDSNSSTPKRRCKPHRGDLRRGKKPAAQTPWGWFLGCPPYFFTGGPRLRGGDGFAECGDDVMDGAHRDARFAERLEERELVDVLQRSPTLRR